MASDHFSIENIPFGIASSAEHPRKAVVTRFEDNVIFLDELVKIDSHSISEETINTFSSVSRKEQSSSNHELTPSRKPSTPSQRSPNPNKEQLANGSSHTSPKVSYLSQNQPHAPSQAPHSIYPSQSETLPTSPALAITLSMLARPCSRNESCHLDLNTSQSVTMAVAPRLLYLIHQL